MRVPPSAVGTTLLKASGRAAARSRPGSQGQDERTIALVDSEGVALAAIQGLHQLMQEKDARIVALKQRVAEVESLRGERAALRSAPAEAL